MKWVSVKERLPLLQEDILVRTAPYGNIWLAQLVVDEEIKDETYFQYVPTDYYYYDRINDVTHWMPLPDFPPESE